MSPTELPPTNGVTSGKEMRGSRFFLVDPDCGHLFAVARSGKTMTADPPELRWAGHQAVIAGALETKGYSWLPLSSPADRQMAMAPDWLLEPLLRSETPMNPLRSQQMHSGQSTCSLASILPTVRNTTAG